MSTGQETIEAYHPIDGLVSQSARSLRNFSVLFILLYFLGSLLLNLHSQFENERNRIAALSPAIARGLYGEFLSGDEIAFQKMRGYLIQKHALIDIFYADASQGCREKPFATQILGRDFEFCTRYRLDGIPLSPEIRIHSKIKKQWFSRAMLGFLFAMVPLMLLTAIYFRRIQQALSRSIANPIQAFAREPERWRPEGSWVAREIVALSRQLRHYIGERDQERDRAEVLHRKAYMGDIAAQVAHDIRSPLAAFNLLAHSLDQLPERDRSNIQKAVARIQYIAQDLIQKYRAQSLSEGVKLGVEHLPALLDAIVLEKQTQLRGVPGKRLLSRHKEEAYGMFVKVAKGDFFRTISNLLDNALEAIETQGTVQLSVTRDHDQLLIRIEDDGKGMTQEVLEKIRGAGGSYGKPQGLGLGLPRAKAFIESWGGRLEIHSESGKGTTVTLRLAEAPRPAWVIPEISVPAGGQVILLDDDPSLPALWAGCLDAVGRPLQHVVTGAQFRELVGGLAPERRAATVFLVDHEIKGEGKIGLNLIVELGIQSRAILVTSYADDADLRASCLKYGVKLLSKDFIGIVPLRCEA